MRLATIGVLLLLLTVSGCQTTEDGQPREPIVYVAGARVVYTAGLDICSDLVRLELLDAEEAKTAEEVRWHLAAALDEAQAAVEAHGSFEYMTLRDAILAAQSLLVRVIERRLSESVDPPTEEVVAEDGPKIENRKLMALLLAATHLLGAGLQIESQTNVTPEQLGEIQAQQAVAEARWAKALASVVSPTVE